MLMWTAVRFRVSHRQAMWFLEIHKVLEVKTNYGGSYPEIGYVRFLQDSYVPL
jgi:hypothetical protein